MGGGIDFRDAWGCSVSGNTFTIIAKRALVIGPNSGRITITGNNFSNSYIGGRVRRDDAASGIVLQGTSDIAITGNVFTGLAGRAIRMEGVCARVAVVGNVVTDSPGGMLGLDLGQTLNGLSENNVGVGRAPENANP